MAITIVVGTVLSNSAAAVGSWDATVVRDLLKFIKKKPVDKLQGFALGT